MDIDGNVWATSRQSALQVFSRQETCLREGDCYRRLFANDFEILAGFDVPPLKDYGNSLWTIETTVVSPPCILDFGQTHVDSPPDLFAESIG